MTDPIDRRDNHTHGWNISDENYHIGTKPREKKEDDTISSAVVEGGVTSIAKWVWDLISYPFAKASEDSAVTMKPGPKGLNGIPALEAPFQINMAAMQKLLNELKELVNQVTKSSNEADEELQDRERLQSTALLIEYLKKQQKIREDGVVNLKFDLVFHTKQNEAVRRTLDDVESALIATNSNRQFWGTIHTGLKWAAVAVFTGTVAMSIFTMSGGTAVPMVMRSISKIPNAFLAVSTAATQIMKSRLDAAYGEKKERSENMRNWRYQNNLRIEAVIENVNSSFDMAQKIRGWLFQVLKNQRDAAHAVNGGKSDE